MPVLAFLPQNQKSRVSAGKASYEVCIQQNKKRLHRFPVRPEFIIYSDTVIEASVIFNAAAGYTVLLGIIYNYSEKGQYGHCKYYGWRVEPQQALYNIIDRLNGGISSSQALFVYIAVYPHVKEVLSGVHRAVIYLCADKELKIDDTLVAGGITYKVTRIFMQHSERWYRAESGGMLHSGDGERRGIRIDKV
jgi:hypothetical protein